MTVKEHYDNHLGMFYSWMAGKFQEKQIEQESFFRRNNITPFESNMAIDLGCGHGLQSVSLARLGFKVEAVDFNEQLLSELEANCAPQKLVNVHHQDLSTFVGEYDRNVDVIVCMGDTITHLVSMHDVKKLCSLCYEKLVIGGTFIVSFRDLTVELHESQRFIPVRSDATRIHTCFLEYFPEHVKVYDILHEKKNGQWNQTVSWYPKLRLSEMAMLNTLTQLNFLVKNVEVINRMIYVVAEKNQE